MWLQNSRRCGSSWCKAQDTCLHVREKIKQITQQEVELYKQLSMVRIHVERIIGLLKTNTVETLYCRHHGTTAVQIIDCGGFPCITGRVGNAYPCC